jgi:hypothetical protein
MELQNMVATARTGSGDEGGTKSIKEAVTTACYKSPRGAHLAKAKKDALECIRAATLTNQSCGTVIWHGATKHVSEVGGHMPKRYGHVVTVQLVCPASRAY